MKKQYFFICMIAATMFAASCSKDDSEETFDSQISTEVNQDVQTQKTHPITIIAEKKSSVSKAHLLDNSLDLVFDNEDVLVLMSKGQKCGELSLIDGAGESSATFEGKINEGVESFTAQIGNELQSFVTSNASLKTLVDANTFLKSEEVYYNGEESFSISLTDQNAYFAISTNLENTTIQFGDATPQQISANEIWLAVNGGTSVTLFGKTSVAAKGQVYSVEKNNFIAAITLSDASATIAVGGTKQLSVSSVSPMGVSNTVAWSSNNTEVASVDEYGVVRGVAVGTTTITATATDGSGTIQTCTVRVNDVPDGYVDLGIDNAEGKQVYFAKDNSAQSKFLDLTEDQLNALPTISEWEALASNCYWEWDASKKGYYVYVAKADADKGVIKNENYTNPTVIGTYSHANESTDTYIFLPTEGFSMAYYWSGTYDETFDKTYYIHDNGITSYSLRKGGENSHSVRLVSRK